MAVDKGKTEGGWQAWIKKLIGVLVAPAVAWAGEVAPLSWSIRRRG